MSQVHFGIVKETIHLLHRALWAPGMSKQREGQVKHGLLRQCLSISSSQPRSPGKPRQKMETQPTLVALENQQWRFLGKTWFNLIILYICWLHILMTSFFKKEIKLLLNLPIEGVHNSIAFVECTATMDFRVLYLPPKQTPDSKSVTPNYQFCFPPKTQQPDLYFLFLQLCLL